MKLLTLVKDYCFLHLSLRQLYCNILEDNKPSLNLFEKAGFKINGIKKDWVRSGNCYKDQLFLQAFKEV
ncbi:MAG: GNAT family protein [Owenweeksia sp.]|nr:GNAT family protein [Owenweeksia sp.]